eukprot:2558649-Prymnesium_polylepis.1
MGAQGGKGDGDAGTGRVAKGAQEREAGGQPLRGGPGEGRGDVFRDCAVCGEPVCTLSQRFCPPGPVATWLVSAFERSPGSRRPLPWLVEPRC